MPPGRDRVVVTVTWSGAGATAVLYLMFAMLLQIRLHPGFLTPLVLRGVGV